MARHITELNVKSYRGITNLEIKDLGDINILLGDNDCGKTSVLEAVQVLNIKRGFNDILKIATQRERNLSIYSKQTYYNAFINLFNKNNENNKDLELNVSCITKDKKLNVSIKGNIGIFENDEVDSNLDEIDFELLNEVGKQKYEEELKKQEEEVESFVGRMYLNDEFVNLKFTKEEDNSFFNKRRARVQSKPIVNTMAVENIAILSTVEHMTENNFKAISQNKQYLKKVIELIQNFDEDIEDLRYIPQDMAGKSNVEVIDSKKFKDFLPISNYGGGTKKIISIADTIISAKDGILLIDEIESAIQNTSLKEVFRFLIKVCKEMNIQVFATTHSIEAVDSMLTCLEEEQENIRVIKLLKTDEKTKARVTNGKKTLWLKDEQGMELR
jgi:AAA15 family ATPase/GTPase